MTRNQSKENLSPRDDAYQAEIEKAAQRIGRTNSEAIDWLVQFAKTDLTALSQGELINLGYEMNCLSDFLYGSGTENFIGNLGISKKDWEGHDRFQKKPGNFEFSEIITALMTEQRPVHPAMAHPSLDQIKNLQTLVSELVSEILVDKNFCMELPKIKLQAFPFQDEDSVLTIIIADSPEDIFLHNIALLLVAGASRIRRCPECETIFFADRKNKFSCSTRCQNTAAVRRMRQSLPKRTGKPGRPPGTTKKGKASPSAIKGKR